MTRSYRIRGAVQTAAPAAPTISDAVVITRARRVVPGISGDAAAGELAAASDTVVRVELDNGAVLWTRADDLIREHGQPALARDGTDAWDIQTRPRAPLRGPAQRGDRGWLGLGIKLLEFLDVDLKGHAAAALGEKLEQKQLHDRQPGLYRCSLGNGFALTPLDGAAAPPPAGDPAASPILVLIHGTASSTAGSFGKLWEGGAGEAARQALVHRYGDRVYALEHRSLTQSPIRNALDLAKALATHLPAHSHVDLVTHSRGGLVGELLCLAERDRTGDPFDSELMTALFAADRTIAEQLGLGRLDGEAAKARDQAYSEDREALADLLRQLDAHPLHITRFVRVACPARGTTLASGRLDRWLSVLNLLTDNGLFGDVADFLLAVVKERTDPRTLPGLEAMLPGSALTRLLQNPALSTRADLTVISGDIEGDSLWGQLKLLATDWFYGADHDLMVNTGSMHGGLRRPPQGARFRSDRGAAVNHFNYFTNKKTVDWLIAGLTRAHDSDGGFLPLHAAAHEEPKWRAAVRRSRSASTPRPLAVVLPGTMGSSLQVDGDPLWLAYWPLFKGGLKRLRKGAGEVLPTGLVDDFYGPLVEFLARSHRVEIFPYDWRLSVRDAAVRLADALEGWLPHSERLGQPVHIVAHSMGGLVVRSMIADGGRGSALWRRIVSLKNSRFLMLGTPNLGSHEAVRWLTGHNPTQTKLTLLDALHSTDQIIDIVSGFPGLLELLPFDPTGADFADPGLWANLREQLAARWRPAEAQALLAARATWDFLAGATPDPQHMLYVAGCQKATVVDYRVVDLDDHPRLVGTKRLQFIATAEGDGTVTWASGRLPGVPTWYVEDTAHDALCAQKSAFPAYLDLLTTGATTRLPKSPPAATRAAGGAARTFILPDLPPADVVPDETELGSFGFGTSPPLDEAVTGRGVPVIEVTLSHGDLAYARHPVLVGHYQGDTIISAEKALDERLGKALSQRLLLGLYPGPLGTHALFFNPNRARKPDGAVVVGLGQVGELSPALLMKGVRDALLDYALRVAQWPDNRFGAAQQVRSAAVSCLLVGSGAGGVSPRDSLEAILRAAVAANDKLVQARLENRVVVDRIEIVELFEDITIAAADALHAVLSDGELATAISWPGGTVETGQGGRRRVRYDDAPDWWQRLEIIEDTDTQRLRFVATTDRARAEETLATGQLRLAENFIRQAARTTSANAEVAKTLFEMLLPNRLKELAPRQADLVLLVDATSARYPWELLEDRWSHSRRPAAVAAGLVRQLKTPVFRPHPAHASELTAFVVGNPDLAGWELFADLPGAREEARKVATLLSAGGYRTLDCIDEKADAILAGLHRGAWRILHLAGHGEHAFVLPDPGRPTIPGGNAPSGGTLSDAAIGKDALHVPGDAAPTRKALSGMVIGKNTFLTPGDVEQMRWVPELVFINCCHLGKTQTGGTSRTAQAGEFSLLAANLAVQFIQMGVKAVVAAGWAVDDAAGAAFAETFYRRLLAGEMFGDAVRAAREEVWVRFPDSNTWGAYQCYGDPSYRLHGNGGPVGRPAGRFYHAPAELVADIDNYAALICMRMHDPDDDSTTHAELRRGILDLLGGVPDQLGASWLERGDVAAAFGFAWGEAGDWAQAVDWLDKALTARVGDCPVKAVEQCANFRVRLSGQRWRALREQPDETAASSARRALITDIEHAIRELDLISLRAPTPERLALLGSACKCLAWLHEAAAPRIEALVNMANYYRQAHEQDRQRARAVQGHPDPYPFSHWVVAKALAELFDSRQDKDWRNGLADACQQMMAEAELRHEDDPNFWNAIGVANCDLALLLIKPGGTQKAADAAATRIAGHYRSAAHRGASPSQYDSVREHVEFVQALVEAGGGDRRLRRTLAAIRAAL